MIIKTQGRDTFTLVNVANGTRTTLVRNAKYLKHAPLEAEISDFKDEEDLNKTYESCNSGPSEISQSEPNLGSQPYGLANRTELTVTTRSGRTVKRPKDRKSHLLLNYLVLRFK